MIEKASQHPYRLCRLFLTLGLVLAAGVLAAAPASADCQGACWWDGKWHTQHEFGEIVLSLHEEGKTVAGTYRNKSEGLKGTISGGLSNHKKTWAGRYRDTEGGSGKGKFVIELRSDKVSFEGFFQACGRIFCGDRVTWTGEHA
jgi:hypothetical protein